MDIFSHWLWGMALTRGKMSWKVSGPMSVLPDLLAFIPASIYRAVNGISRTSVDDNTVTSDMPVAWEIYQWSHSLTIVAFCIVVDTTFSNQRDMKNQVIWHGFSFCLGSSIF